MDVGAGSAGAAGDPGGAAGCWCAGGGGGGSVAAAAAALGAAGLAGLDADAALGVVLAARRAQAAAFAVELDGLARMVAVYPEHPARAVGEGERERVVVLELMAALGVSQRSAGNRVGLALYLAGHPGLAAALRAGSLDVPAVLGILERILPLARDARAEAVARLLAAHAATPGGLTRAQLSRLLGRIVAVLDPGGAERRRVDAVAERRVEHQPAGTAGSPACLAMTGPAERVGLCAEAVDALARAILAHRRARATRLGPATGDGGEADAAGGVWEAAHRLTLEQARFDALEWLITGAPATEHPSWPGHPERTSTPHTAPHTAADTGHTGDDSDDGDDGAAAPERAASPGHAGIFRAPAGAGGCGCGRPRVSVTAQVLVPLSALIGLDDAPGELVGHGAVPAAVARELAASARVWQRLLTDPVDGHLVTQAIRCYRPDAAIAAFVRARGGGVCAARGCTARHGLQIDHDTPWPHGPTSAGNTVLLHGSHHQPKTDRIWRHRLDPDTGALSQISPLGRRYTTRPLPPLGGPLAGPSGTTGRDPAAGSDPDPGPCERRLGALLRRTPATGPPAGPHTEPGSAPPVIEVHPRRHHRPSG